MELKKYFHDKIISSVISVLIGSFLIAIFIMTQTLELQVVLTYGFLFIVFVFLFQLIKSTVKKVRKERFKLGKEWGLIIATSLLVICFAIVSYYTSNTIYRVAGVVFLALSLGADYCLYRFVYLPKIFKDKRVREEVLYFSWKMWGEMLDNGTTDEVIADKIVSAQTICNSRLDNSSWGARFSDSTLYDGSIEKSDATSGNVDISLATLEQLKKLALVIVHTYEKKKDNK